MDTTRRGASAGRLRIRVGPPARAGRPEPGVHRLGLDPGRDGLLLVPGPPRVPASATLPLVIGLHGAGGTGRQMIEMLAPSAERRGFLLLAPDSRATTWDVLGPGYGPDVEFLERALRQVLGSAGADPSRLTLAGFSDGASYAASLGLANGDLFGSVLAYSPGFAAPGIRTGKARFFVSHGLHDPVLPIDSSSRRLVPLLLRDGHEVTYREFPGGHDVPAEVTDESMDWLFDPA